MAAHQTGKDGTATHVQNVSLVHPVRNVFLRSQVKCAMVAYFDLQAKIETSVRIHLPGKIVPSVYTRLQVLTASCASRPSQESSATNVQVTGQAKTVINAEQTGGDPIASIALVISPEVAAIDVLRILLVKTVMSVCLISREIRVVSAWLDMLNRTVLSALGTFMGNLEINVHLISEDQTATSVLKISEASYAKFVRINSLDHSATYAR